MPSVPTELFATCPQSTDYGPSEYRRRVAEVARWSERHGCTGILVYSDNRLVDPWLASQIIIEHTERLCPLVAVQPVYMHPYSVAKMVATFGHLYGRRIYLNMVAGGFRNDLIALNDPTPHDRRYQRLTEYTDIIKQLLAGDGPVTYMGAFYEVKNLKLVPALDRALFPGIFMSGSSPASLQAARAIRATAVCYPQPPDQETTSAAVLGLEAGMRVGIIARKRADEAWAIARQRFPEDRRGQLTHQLAMKVSDSQWHRQLSALAAEPVSHRNPYWLVPFENYKTMCPYLVGSYDRVGEELARCLDLGYRSFILDIPPDEAELIHTQRAFRRALALAGEAASGTGTGALRRA